MHDARVFISHSSKQAPEAVRLRDALEARGMDAWAYEGDLPFGTGITTQIRERVAEADHFVVLLSDDACNAPWVQRELGLALRLRQQRGAAHPSILGVLSEHGCVAKRIVPKDYDTGQDPPTPFEFGSLRYLSLPGRGHDDVAWLVEQLRPRVTVVTETDSEQGALLRESFRCYEWLFPDRAERDDPLDIETWLDEARRGALVGYPWREVYAVLHMHELAIGMAYLSVHLDRHWCFGNYFGVRSGWRQSGRAEMLLDHVWRHLRPLDAQLRGIVFEVEPVDFAHLNTAADAAARGDRPSEQTLTNLRRMRRLVLYQGCGASALLDAEGRPFRYIQPAMSTPLGPEGERELIVMVMPAPGQEAEDFNAQRLLSFIYDAVFLDAYGGASGARIDGFREYLESVRNRVEQRLGAGWRFGRVEIPRKLRDLLRRCLAAGYSSALDL